MAVCELCGSVVNSTNTINVAGSNMQACNSCKGMGKEVNPGPSGSKSHSFYKRKKSDVSLSVVENYGSLINSTLAKKGLNVHQLAMALSIKESNLSKYLGGKMKPDVATARKIENFLEITLVEEVESVDAQDFMADVEEDTSGMSLGEMLKKQLEKNK